jgi:hypothetical protein
MGTRMEAHLGLLRLDRDATAALLGKQMKCWRMGDNVESGE